MSYPLKKIGELEAEGAASIQTGPFGTQLKASDYSPEGVPVINVRNIGYGDLRPEKLEFVPEATAERLGVHVLTEQDIVFGRKGAVDRHLFVANGQSGWVQGSDCIRLRLSSKEINPRFVSYAFLSSRHKDWMLQQCGNKATMASLNQDVIRRIELRLPHLGTQDEIVSILSAYDDLIENNRRRMALLEEAARLLYSEWFVHFRFPGHEHVKMIDGLPEGWERRTLGDLMTLKRGYDLPEARRLQGDIPIVSSSGITGYHNAHKVIGPGIVTGRYGTLGQVFLIYRNFWPLNTSLYVRDMKGHYTSYLLHLLRHCLPSAQSDKAAVPGLDRNTLHTIKIVVPPPLLRCQFDEFASANLRQTKLLTDANEKLIKVRDLLLPRLINGDIAV